MKNTQTKLKQHRKYILLYVAPLTLSFFILSNNTFTNTSALDYQSNTNLQFTLNPTLAINISGNLAIDNLSPGTAKDSNIIDVNVATNNVTGYVLTATVGNTNNPSNELRHSSYSNNSNNNSNNNYKFTSTSTDITELSNLEPDTWGYNYSTDKGVTWHDYSTLPLYNTAGTTLSEKYIASNDTIKFKIGAKASSTQASGTYTNTINFYATANQSPVTFTEAFALAGKTQHNGYYTMQDMSHSICEAVDIDANIQLIDIRDNETYTIAKLKDENCWMLDNLRLGGDEPITLTNQDTNMVAESWTLPENTIDKPSDFYTNPLIISIYENSSATKYGIGSGKTGVYYNYCSASAGTYCFEKGSGSGDSVYDVCSANWQIPTRETYQSLYLRYNTTQDASRPESLQYNFSAPLAGQFSFGEFSQIYFNVSSRFWSASFSYSSGMADLYASALGVKPDDGNDRGYGFSIRCLAK